MSGSLNNTFTSRNSKPVPQNPVSPNISPRLPRRHSPKPTQARSKLHAAAAAPAEVVCIGEALFEDFLANDFDVPRERVRSWTPKAGGASCNVAAGLAKLGVSVSFYSAIGDDKFGDQLVELLTDIGVFTEDVQRRPEPTRDVYVTRTSQGEREFVGFGQETDSYADCCIDVNLLPMDKLKMASVLVTGTLGQAYGMTASAIRTAVATAKEHQICVLIDVNWRPVFFKDPSCVKDAIVEFVREADIIKLTDEEAEWMFNLDPATAMNSPQTVLDMFPNSKGVLVTAGAKGASYSFRAKAGVHCGFFPAFDIQAVDTTGAGDAFTSGFIYQLIQFGGLTSLLSSTASIDKAVRFACASGSLTVGAPGAIEGQPTKSEIESILKTTN